MPILKKCMVFYDVQGEKSTKREIIEIAVQRHWSAQQILRQLTNKLTDRHDSSVEIHSFWFQQHQEEVSPMPPDP